MRHPLALAVAQPLCISYDLIANAEKHAAMIRSADARVVVFPELSLTGYELDAVPITTSDPRLGPIVEACEETETVALVGAPVGEEPGLPHMGMLVVDGRGVTVGYEKMWLAQAEAERFASGEKPAVLEVDGWRLGLAICKDTGHPEHAQDTAALGIDAYVAATLKSSEEGAIQHQRARRVATDFNVWVAVASFAGRTGGGFEQAAGCSAIWSPDGFIVAQAGPEPGAMAVARLGVPGPTTSSRRPTESRPQARG